MARDSKNFVLHLQGIVHRDVKPGNFLFSRKAHKGYLIDFNLAMVSYTSLVILMLVSSLFPLNFSLTDYNLLGYCGVSLYV